MLKKIESFIKKTGNKLSRSQNGPSTSEWLESRVIFSSFVFLEFNIFYLAIVKKKRDESDGKYRDILTEARRELDLAYGDLNKTTEIFSRNAYLLDQWKNPVATIYEVIEFFLKPDYEPPKNLGEIWLHLFAANIYYQSVCLMGAVYPELHARIDMAMMKLSWTAAVWIGEIDSLGHIADSTEPGIKGKKKMAQKRREDIGPRLIKDIAATKEKNKRSTLIAEAMKKGGYTDARTIKKMAKEYDEGKKNDNT